MGDRGMNGIKSVKKSFEILFLFNNRDPKLSAQEISRKIGIPVSSIYRYLTTLENMGVLEYDAKSRKYTLGLRLFEIAAFIYTELELRRIARASLRNLAEQTKETVYLIGLHGDKAICIDRIESNFAVRLSINIGDTFPLYSCATGQAIMAYLPKQLQEKIIKGGLERFTEHTVADASSLRSKLRQIAKQRFAYSNGEFDEGARAVSAPIFNALSRVVGGLSVAGPIHRFTDEKIQAYKELVIENAQTVSARLGATWSNLQKR